MFIPNLPSADFDFTVELPGECTYNEQWANFQPLAAHLHGPLLFLALSPSKYHFWVLNSLAWDAKVGPLLLEAILVLISDTTQLKA